MISPLIAVILGASTYILFRSLRLRLKVEKEWCLCVGTQDIIIPIPQPGGVLARTNITLPDVAVGCEESCSEQYTGKFFGVNCQQLLDVCHYLSAGVVSFARGLNDTPKIVGLLFTVKALGIQWGMLAVACSIAAGGLLNAKKVAVTMSKKITPLNSGQGLTANIVTGFLVIFASRWGVPVSTTHVSVGSLFGIGMITGKGNKRVILEILLSWILTLPAAAFFSGTIYWVMSL